MLSKSLLVEKSLKFVVLILYNVCIIQCSNSMLKREFHYIKINAFFLLIQKSSNPSPAENEADTAVCLT